MTVGRLRRFSAYLSPFSGAISILFASIVANVLITVPLPWIEKIIVDDAIGGRDLDLLYGLVALTVGLIVVHRLVVFARCVLSAKVKQKVLTNVRLQMYEHLQRMSPGFFARHETGSLLSRITNDVGYVQNLLNDELFEVIGSAHW